MSRKQWTARRHNTTNNLRVLRAFRRWSQDEVAARMGLKSKFRYWQIENEEVDPTKAELKKLCRVFRCTAEDMFPARVKAIAS